MIPVTKPFMPPQEIYDSYLKGIWKRQWLTNMGPLASELEIRIREREDVKYALFVTNGTIALQLAIKALGLKGEIITTPFSFVATTSSIVWEGCTPVFVDIDSESMNIDPEKIEAAITKNTTAILATHVYGNPCDVEQIDQIAKKHNLKVIYDGAHSFGVNLNGKSIFGYGDISVCSLHATKLYHSVEGGLIFTNNSTLVKRLERMRNFGFNGPENFSELGINGKNSEFHAAMGLANLDFFDSVLEQRKKLFDRYRLKLKGLRVIYQKWHECASNNAAYFPILFESEQMLLKCHDQLKVREIFTRRYFYPSLASVLPYLEKSEMPVTEAVAKHVLCLPLYYDLAIEEVDLICRIIVRTHEN